MDLVDLDLCVVLPVKALDAWVRAEPGERASWLHLDGPVAEIAVGGETAFVFRRERPRPSKALIVVEARHKVAVVVSGSDAAVAAALDDPDEALTLSAHLRVPSGLLVIGGDLAHADVAGGTPVAGPHRIVDLAPGAYRVELRSIGEAGEPGFARVISYEPVSQ